MCAPCTVQPSGTSRRGMAEDLVSHLLAHGSAETADPSAEGMVSPARVGRSRSSGGHAGGVAGIVPAALSGARGRGAAPRGDLPGKRGWQTYQGPRLNWAPPHIVKLITAAPGVSSVAAYHPPMGVLIQGCIAAGVFQPAVGFQADRARSVGFRCTLGLDASCQGTSKAR